MLATFLNNITYLSCLLIYIEDYRTFLTNIIAFNEKLPYSYSLKLTFGQKKNYIFILQSLKKILCFLLTK